MMSAPPKITVEMTVRISIELDVEFAPKSMLSEVNVFSVDEATQKLSILIDPADGVTLLGPFKNIKIIQELGPL